MSTAQELIEGSLRLIGQLETGETADASTLADSLTAMNQMIDSWSTERLSVFCMQDQQFTWPANTISRTIGPTGNFVGNRPVLVDDSTYFYANNLRYSLVLLNVDQYNGIALPTVTSTLPQALYVNMTMPDATMYIYPVPTQAIEIHIMSVLELTQPPTLATSLVIPPGYLRAFRYNLAIEIASEFGIDPPQKVSRIADLAKRTIKRINNPNDIMSMPYSLIGRRKNNFNVFSGLPL
jgi:hypothetical protein